MSFFKKPILSFVLIFALAGSFLSCSKSEKTANQLKVAAFLPGVRAESSVYSMLADGVEKAVAEAVAEGKDVSVDVIEAGTNQSQWAEKLMALASEEKYDLIISSNPSLPELVSGVVKQFPKQKFLLFDAYAEGMPQVSSFRYNQQEQAYIAGYMAGLVTVSNMKYANSQKKIGLIAGQEYPVMQNIILPSFLKGAQAIDPEITVDFRVVGNWYDASKSLQLAKIMHTEGCDVIMPISGGANQGVISAAQELGFYVSWFDDNGYAKAPGYVVSSSVMEQEKLVYEQTTNFINGKLEMGKASTLGITDGYVRFVEDDDIYISTVPEELRKKQAEMLEMLKSGKLVLSDN